MQTDWSTTSRAEVTNLPTTNSTDGEVVGVLTIFQVIVRNGDGVMSAYAFKAVTPGGTMTE